MRTLLASLALVAACDADTTADPDAAATDASVDVDLGSAVGTHFGADPSSGAFVPGSPSYTPDDPRLDPAAVVMGADRSRVLADGWDGPLVAAAERDALRAERTRLADPSESAAVDPGAALARARAESGSWLVSAGEPVLIAGPEVDPDWAARPLDETPRRPVAGETFVARLPVALDRLPAELRALIGVEVRVFSAEREVCIARVSGLALEARLVHEPFGPWEPAYSEVDLMRRGLRSVVGELEPLAGAGAACDEGVAAVGVGAASPALYSEALLDRRVERAAIETACTLPEARAWLEAELGEVSSWRLRQRCEASVTEVRAYATRAGERVVLVRAFDRVLGFRVSGSGQAVRAHHVFSHDDGRVFEAVLDLQGDGTPELLLAGTRRAPRSVAGATYAGDLEVPTFLPDGTPIPPRRLAVGGYGTPDFSVFRAER